MGRIGFGQSSCFTAGAMGFSSPSMSGGTMSNMLMQTMMRALMQLMMQCFSASSGGGFSQLSHPGFGGGGQNGQCPTMNGGGQSCNPFQGFLGCGNYENGGNQGGARDSYDRGNGYDGGLEGPGSAGGAWAQNLPAPLRQYAPSFEKYGKKYGVDPKFLASISMLETGNGTSSAFRNKNNAMGVSNKNGPISFASVDASIEKMARSMGKRDGLYAGTRTIGEIAGVYCPVGASNDRNGTNHHWPRMVSRFYGQLGGDPNAAVR